MPDAGSREPWFISAAHNREDIAATLTAFEGALPEVMGQASISYQQPDRGYAGERWKT